MRYFQRVYANLVSVDYVTTCSERRASKLENLFAIFVDIALICCCTFFPMCKNGYFIVFATRLLEL